MERPLWLLTQLFRNPQLSSSVTDAIVPIKGPQRLLAIFGCLQEFSRQLCPWKNSLKTDPPTNMGPVCILILRTPKNKTKVLLIQPSKFRPLSLNCRSVVFLFGCLIGQFCKGTKTILKWLKLDLILSNSGTNLILLKPRY